MFTYLKNLLRARTHATHSSDAGTRPLELSDEALRFALEPLLDFVLAPLPSNEQERLRTMVLSHWEEDRHPLIALERIIGVEQGQRRGNWLLMQLDWKAVEEIDWQVDEILATLGLEPLAEAISSEDANNSVEQAFDGLAQRLQQGGLSLIQFETEGDYYHAAIRKKSEVSTFWALTAAADI